MSKVRVNFWMERDLYESTKAFVVERGMTLTGLFVDAVSQAVKAGRHESDKAAFDKLADEAMTREMDVVEKECSSDGL
jgi:hypothetical protein